MNHVENWSDTEEPKRAAPWLVDAFEPADFVSTNTKSLVTPTDEMYGALEDAFAFFNDKLFAARLPPVAFNMQRRGKAYGHFYGGRFARRDGSEVADEISINPQYIHAQPVTNVLSTVVHEMVHTEQHHFGKPGRAGYHNKQFAAWMRRVGLIASDTGMPDGKQTGQRMSHYVEPNGPFDRVCIELLADGFTLDWGDQQAQHDLRGGKPALGTTNKSTYSCPQCNLNVWGKPGLSLICGQCRESLVVR
jgi:predicted SprT family Zn-dependent metalloprotease